jgi:hypothetical protein
MRRERWLVMAFLLNTSAVAAGAQGLTCVQACGDACGQAMCAPARASGSCGCGSGALRLDQNTFAAYCRSWGTLQTGCDPPPLAANASSTTSLVPNRDEMVAAILPQNPFVAALVVAAMRDNAQGATVQGLLHDSQYDVASGITVHTAAVAFSGKLAAATSTGVQIDITVQGDLNSLTFLAGYCATAAPGAIAPAAVHGLATSGGLHGSLLVTSSAGQTQTLVW